MGLPTKPPRRQSRQGNKEYLPAVSWRSWPLAGSFCWTPLLSSPCPLCLRGASLAPQSTAPLRPQSQASRIGNPKSAIRNRQPAGAKRTQTGQPDETSRTCAKPFPPKHLPRAGPTESRSARPRRKPKRTQTPGPNPQTRNPHPETQYRAHRNSSEEILILHLTFTEGGYITGRFGWWREAFLLTSTVSRNRQRPKVRTEPLCPGLFTQRRKGATRTELTATGERPLVLTSDNLGSESPWCSCRKSLPFASLRLCVSLLHERCGARRALSAKFTSFHSRSKCTDRALQNEGGQKP